MVNIYRSSIMKRIKERAEKFKIGDVPITSPYLRLSKESKAAMHTINA